MHYKITVYIPQEHCEAVKIAMFKAGAGVIDNYADCAWQVLGKGQFRPLEGSNPFLGEQEKIEEVAEYKVEIFCVADKIKEAIDAMKKAHPYEVPAYGVVKLEDF
jgi:structural hemagglutinin/hemolysin toxin protein RtxA